MKKYMQPNALKN